MEPMIFFNVGWMKRYDGITDDDRPQGGGAWVGEHGWDHAMMNFRPVEGWYYGYGETRGAVNMERLGRDPSTNSLEGVTVVWVSTSPALGPVIVGWYRKATVFRDSQQAPEKVGRQYNGEPILYRAKARVEDSFLIPVERRTFSVPRGKGGMGQANVWYADAPESMDFKFRVSEYIRSGGEAKGLPAHTWIFQTNPKLYNIEGALQKLKEIGWAVTRHKAEIQPGDQVFIWRSGEDSGIVAEGTVTTIPQERERSEEEMEFVLNLESLPRTATLYFRLA